MWQVHQDAFISLWPESRISRTVIGTKFRVRAWISVPPSSSSAPRPTAMLPAGCTLFIKKFSRLPAAKTSSPQLALHHIVDVSAGVGMKFHQIKLRPMISLLSAVSCTSITARRARSLPLQRGVSCKMRPHDQWLLHGCTFPPYLKTLSMIPTPVRSVNLFLMDIPHKFCSLRTTALRQSMTLSVKMTKIVPVFALFTRKTQKTGFFPLIGAFQPAADVEDKEKATAATADRKNVLFCTCNEIGVFCNDSVQAHQIVCRK